MKSPRVLENQFCNRSRYARENFKILQVGVGMTARASGPNRQEAEAHRWLQVLGQADLHISSTLAKAVKWDPVSQIN